jgi:hypothetical protein
MTDQAQKVEVWINKILVPMPNLNLQQVQEMREGFEISKRIARGRRYDRPHPRSYHHSIYAGRVLFVDYE